MAISSGLSSGMLRICTAGSVDDGKSTLIGRLLYDSQSVYEDQVSSIEKASKNRNAGPIDFSLFTDGLRAEREQGITIDVAYRCFATARRKFIWPTRRGTRIRAMATGAPPAVAICWWTRATACARSRGGTPASRACSASPTSSWP
jgi:bifunctional enzyme CysN/CysC/sulfate adenylyltransferase subunit 1